MKNVLVLLVKFFLGELVSVNDLVRLLIARHLSTETKDFSSIAKILLSLQGDVKYHLDYVEWDGTFSYKEIFNNSHDTICRIKLEDGSLHSIDKETDDNGWVHSGFKYQESKKQEFENKARMNLKKEILEIVSSIGKWDTDKATYSDYRLLVSKLVEKNIVDIDIREILIILNDNEAWKQFAYESHQDLL